MDLSALEAKYGTLDAPKKKGRGGFLSSIISEAGGLGGALGGAAAGTAVLPGIGTIIGGLAGGFLGGTGGSAVEQKVRDDKIDISKALGEGALEGLFAAGPIRLGKIGVAGAKALAKGVGKTGAKEAMQVAATKPGITKSLLSRVSGRVGKGADNVANDAALKNFKINDSNWITKFAQRVGEDPGSFARRLGFAVDSPKNIGDNFYNPLQEAYETALDKIPAISKSSIEQGFKEVYEPLLKTYARKDLGKKIQERTVQLLKELPESMDAHDARAIKAEFQSLVDQTLTDKAGKLDNDINKQIADVFRKVINKSADDAGIAFKPGDLPIPGAKATNLTELGNELRGIKEFADKAAVKVNVGRGKNPVALTPMMAGAAGGGAMGLPGAVTAGVGSIAANSTTGRKAEFKVADLLSRVLNRGGNTTNTPPKPSALGLTGRVVAGSAIDNVVQPDVQESPLDPSTIDATQIASMNNSPPSASNMPTLDTISPETSSAETDIAQLQAGLQQAALKALAAGDSKGLENIIKVAGLFESIQKMNESKTKPLNASQRKEKNNAESALADIGRIRSAIANDPSAVAKSSLPGGSFTQRITGTSELAAAQKNVVDAIARLRSGAAITEDEAKRYLALLPSKFDSAEDADKKLSRLEELLTSFTYQDGTGGSDLEDLIGDEL